MRHQKPLCYKEPLHLQEDARSGSLLDAAEDVGAEPWLFGIRGSGAEEKVVDGIGRDFTT